MGVASLTTPLRDRPFFQRFFPKMVYRDLPKSRAEFHACGGAALPPRYQTTALDIRDTLFSCGVVPPYKLGLIQLLATR